jgi:hypothetical protein
MHGTGKRNCHIQVPVIGKISFLNALKKSWTYQMLSVSRQPYTVWTFTVLIDIASSSGRSVRSFETIIHLIIQESVSLVGLKDVNITFLEWIVTYDETWVRSFTPGSK